MWFKYLNMYVYYVFIFVLVLLKCTAGTFSVLCCGVRLAAPQRAGGSGFH